MKVLDQDFSSLYRKVCRVRIQGLKELGNQLPREGLVGPYRSAGERAGAGWHGSRDDPSWRKDLFSAIGFPSGAPIAGNLDLPLGSRIDGQPASDRAGNAHQLHALGHRIDTSMAPPYSVDLAPPYGVPPERVLPYSVDLAPTEEETASLSRLSLIISDGWT